MLVRKPKVNGLNGIGYNKDKWTRDHFDRDDVIDSGDMLSQKRMPNSFTTTIETTSFRGNAVNALAETPGTSSNMKAALRGVEYIAQHIKNQDKDNEVSD